MHLDIFLGSGENGILEIMVNFKPGVVFYFDLFFSV